MGSVAIRLALPMSPNFVPLRYEGHIKQHDLSKNSCAWGGFEHGMIGKANDPCGISEKICDVTLADSFGHAISAVWSIPMIV